MLDEYVDKNIGIDCTSFVYARFGLSRFDKVIFRIILKYFVQPMRVSILTSKYHNNISNIRMRCNLILNSRLMVNVHTPLRHHDSKRSSATCAYLLQALRGILSWSVSLRHSCGILIMIWSYLIISYRWCESL